jgi:hypothetical protein
MSKQIRFRRGTSAQHATFTGAEAEITVDTTKNCLAVHDGVTVGGVDTLREDRPRGFTKLEIFTTSGTWTQTGKTDLKRIRVTAYGGGGGGANNGSGGAGNSGSGGAGGIGLVTLEASSVTTNVTVTIGAAGGINNSGGTTSFGTYISATGGSPGSGNSGGAGGTATGTGVFILGGQGGSASIWSQGNFPAAGHYNSFNNTGATGGGLGGGRTGVSGTGITGSGGGSNASGSAGSVIVEEIYGFV